MRDSAVSYVMNEYTAGSGLKQDVGLRFVGLRLAWHFDGARLTAELTRRQRQRDNFRAEAALLT